jgi:ribonuclease HI
LEQAQEEFSPLNRNLEITVDGSCTPWKRMAVGYVIRDVETRLILDQGHIDFPGYGTNNVAEYRALVIGCQRAARLKPKSAILYTDSQLVLRQLQGEYSIRSKQLKHEHAHTVRVLKSMRARVRWHPREDGDGPMADKLASYKHKEVPNGSYCYLRDGSRNAGGSDNGVHHPEGFPARYDAEDRLEQQVENLVQPQPPAAPLPEASGRHSKKRDPTVKLDPGMFPDPAAAQALMEAAVAEDDGVLYPNENAERQGEVPTLKDLKDNPFLPPRGAGR